MAGGSWGGSGVELGELGRFGEVGDKVRIRIKTRKTHSAD